MPPIPAKARNQYRRISAVVSGTDCMASSSALTTDCGENGSSSMRSAGIRFKNAIFWWNTGNSPSAVLSMERASVRADTYSSSTSAVCSDSSSVGLLGAVGTTQGFLPLRRKVSSSANDSAMAARIRNRPERASSNDPTTRGAYSLAALSSRMSARRSNAAANCRLLRCSMRSRDALSIAIVGKVAAAASVDM